MVYTICKYNIIEIKWWFLEKFRRVLTFCISCRNTLCSSTKDLSFNAEQDNVRRQNIPLQSFMQRQIRTKNVNSIILIIIYDSGLTYEREVRIRYYQNAISFKTIRTCWVRFSINRKKNWHSKSERIDDNPSFNLEVSNINWVSIYHW